MRDVGGIIEGVLTSKKCGVLCAGVKSVVVCPGGVLTVRVDGLRFARSATVARLRMLLRSMGNSMYVRPLIG